MVALKECTDLVVLDSSGQFLDSQSADLRDRGPVVPVVLPGDIRAWAVTDFSVLKGLLVDSRVSKDAGAHWPDFITGVVPEDWELRLWVSAPNMFTAYGKDHQRLRTLVAPAFTRKRTDMLQPRIEEITGELLGDLKSVPTGEVVDLRERFAYVLPIRVINELMGVPEPLGPVIKRCVDRVFSTTLSPKQEADNTVTLWETLRALVEYHRDNPGEDVTSALIAQRDDNDGSRLSETELVGTLLLIISAGHETTVNLLDQALVNMVTHPGLLTEISDDLLSWDEVIEETLRFQAPVAHLPLRYAVDDIEIASENGTLVPIGKGEPILASFITANRDRNIHGPTADEFDPHRDVKDHMAFGYGVHRCLGAPLARLEARTALPRIFDTFPRMRLAVPAEQLDHVSSFISNGHKKLPMLLK